MKTSTLVAGLVVAMVILNPDRLKGQTLTWLWGLLNYETQARAVSDDSVVVVGEAEAAGSGHHAVRWLNGTAEDLGTFGGVWSAAHGISPDGRFIVGYASDSSNNHRAFRWSLETGLQNLGTLGGQHSEAYDLSDDGSVVVGYAKDSYGHSVAFRWANGVMQSLGTLGGEHSNAYATSADGSIVVGWSRNSSNDWRAFRWENGVMEDIGTLGGKNSTALNISADGRVIVGYADTALSSSRYHAFRWEDGVMEDLGTLGGKYSEAYDVSADGQIVVGWSEDSLSNWRAFIWHRNGQMRDLNEIYADLLSDGSSLAYATGISTDGKYICGWGWHAGAMASKTAFILYTEVTPGMDDNPVKGPDRFRLAANYPNPFNPATTIKFQLPRTEWVILEIFDVQGNRIKLLLNKYMLAGEHIVRWNGTNQNGQPVAGGVYWYRLRAGNFSETKKMVLLK